jgi:hypothetical protein
MDRDQPDHGVTLRTTINENEPKPFRQMQERVKPNHKKKGQDILFEY